MRVSEVSSLFLVLTTPSPYFLESMTLVVALEDVKNVEARYILAEVILEGREVNPPRHQSTRRLPIVLVIDDNPAIRDMVSWALELDGYESAEASDGLEALA